MKKSVHFLILSLFLLIAGACGQDISPSQASFENAVAFQGYLYGNHYFMSTMASLRMVPVDRPANLTEMEVAENPGCGCAVMVTLIGRTRVFVDLEREDQFFEIHFSSLMPWRPVFDLSWESGDTFSFIMTSNPRYGWYYRINVRTHQMTFLRPVHWDLP